MSEVSYVISSPFGAVTKQLNPPKGEKGVVGSLRIVSAETLLKFSKIWPIPATQQNGRFVTFKELYTLNGEGQIAARHPAAGDPRRITNDPGEADRAREQGLLVAQLS